MGNSPEKRITRTWLKLLGMFKRGLLNGISRKYQIGKHQPMMAYIKIFFYRIHVHLRQIGSLTERIPIKGQYPRMDDEREMYCDPEKKQ